MNSKERKWHIHEQNNKKNIMKFDPLSIWSFKVLIILFESSTGGPYPFTVLLISKERKWHIHEQNNKKNIMKLNPLSIWISFTIAHNSPTIVM
jgi:hypothetical protein